MKKRFVIYREEGKRLVELTQCDYHVTALTAMRNAAREFKGSHILMFREGKHIESAQVI